jgi:hypothetical protein
MKSHHLAALLAAAATLSLAAPFAHAGRDETLIQQTRKNQLAHDACVEQSRQAQARQQKQEQQRDAAPAGQAQQQRQAPH